MPEEQQPNISGGNGKIIAVIVLVLIAAAIAIFMMRGGSERDASNNSVTPPNEVASNNESGQESLKNLLARSGNHECTFTDTQPSGTSEGTVYVSGGKMRGDFSITSNSVTTRSHMITKDGQSFVWTDDSTTGFKMEFNQETQAQASGPQHGVDPNKNFSFSCKSWSVDSGKFSEPSNITFTDYSSLFTAPPTSTPNGIPPATQDIKTMQRAACDQLPEPQKTQCRNAIQ